MLLVNEALLLFTDLSVRCFNSKIHYELCTSIYAPPYPSTPPFATLIQVALCKVAFFHTKYTCLYTSLHYLPTSIKKLNLHHIKYWILLQYLIKRLSNNFWFVFKKLIFQQKKIFLFLLSLQKITLNNDCAVSQNRVLLFFN
jgi:hypothetical protein